MSEVFEFPAAGDKLFEAGHADCIFELSNEKNVMTNNYDRTVSPQFLFDETYKKADEKRATVYRLRDADNPLSIHREIRLMETKDITAELLNHQGCDSADPGEKIAYLTKAVRIDPANASAHYNLGWAYYTSWEASGEETLVERSRHNFFMAIAMNPDHAEAYNSLGTIEANAYSDTANAVGLWNKAISINKHCTGAYIKLAQV